jgi:hypothetical protein
MAAGHVSKSQPTSSEQTATLARKPKAIAFFSLGLASITKSA